MSNHAENLSPLVSVIVPNYNHARFLRQRLESILTQTMQDFELILLDDASSDDSRRVLDEYAHHPKVSHCCYNAHNSGSPYVQWNKGLRLARGRYVWIAESDDYAAADFLERLLAVMEAAPQVGVAFCKSHKVDECGTLMGSTDDWLAELGAERWQRDFVASGRQQAGGWLIYKCIIPNVSSALIRRDVLLQIGGSHEAMRYCGDYLTYVKLLEISDLAYVASPLNHFRFSTQSVRTQMVHSWLHEQEKTEVLSRVARGYEISAVQLALARDSYFTRLLRIARYDRVFLRQFLRRLPDFKAAAAGFCPDYYRALLGRLARQGWGVLSSHLRRRSA